MLFPNISPVAFSILGFDIRWYALAYIFSFILGFYYIKHILRNSTNNILSYTELDDLFTYMIIGVILGGRIGYTLFYNFNFYFSHPLNILKIWEGGMSFHGGLLGCIITLFLWCKKHNKNFLYIADILCMAAPIGLFFGRIANFVNGELYGRITTSKIGIIFPNTNGLPRHPSQLYEALTEGLLLFIILYSLRKIKSIKNRYGIIAFSFICLYGVARVSMENFRQPDAQLGFFKYGLTMGQILTIPMIVISVFMIIYLFKKGENIEIYTSSPLLDSDKITTRFFTRQNGVSKGVFANANCKFETSDLKDNVKQNRKLLLSTIGLDADSQLITLNQKHTNEIIVINKPISSVEKYLNTEADGIITNQKNIAVGILTADCVPVLLCDEKNNLIGAIHCGWQGIYKNIIHNTITKMSELGSCPKNIKVALGPCLKQKSYEVSYDFVKDIIKQNIKYKKLFKKISNEKYLFDCTTYCIMKLKEEGIKIIEILNFDTYKNTDLFFSYRRSLINKEYANDTPTDEGRQLSMIVMK